MNDRLWELFHQANHPHPKHGGNDMFFPEEFAEMIIRECADIVKKEMDYHANWCDDKILNRFGLDKE